jgi:hypothetical protein
MKRKQPILLLAIMLGFAAWAGAQGDKATVVGTVTDSSGAVLPGAEVSLTRVSTNEVVTTIATETGDFAIRGLVPDVYQLKVTMTGFKTELRTGQKLEVGRTYRMDTKMTVGAPSEQVEVTSVAPILKTEAPELGQVIDNQKIISIPLNNRDVFGILGSLTPGVQPTRGATDGGGVQFNVKGMRQSDNYGMIDGSMVSETNGSLQFFVNPDTVQEFEVKTGLYGAEYGIKPGGQFSLVTKSGTNDLHGTAYWLHRNDNLDARNFFDPGPRPEFKRNQFGAVAGGPIYLPKLLNGKDKAWWFVGFSRESVRRFVSNTGNVPTADEKAGRFATAITDPSTGQPFPNNTIPSSRFDPVAVKLLQYWPAPNTTGRGFNFTGTSNAALDKWEILAKVDFRTSAKSRWSARFLYSDNPNLQVNTIDYFTVTNPLFNVGQNLTNTRTFGTSVVNEWGIHYYRRPYFPGFAIQEKLGPDFAKGLGIKNFPSKTVDTFGVPRVSVTNLLAIGDIGNFGPVPEGNWEVKDSVSWTRGAHLFKAGYHFRQQFFALLLETRSSFGFTNDRYTGNAFANYLLGYASSAAQGAENRDNVHQVGHHFYFQDNWKVTPNLTLNLGMRYELRLPWVDKRGYLSNLEIGCVRQNVATPIPTCYDPPVAIANPVFPQTGRFQPQVGLFEFSKRAFQPRVGLSYRLSDRTVVRSGFGIYGNEPLGGMVYGALGGTRNPRANAGQQNYNASPTTPNLLLSDPFSGTAAGGGLPTTGGFQNPMPMWYAINWGTSIERQLTNNTMFEIGYQGTHSVHEFQVIEINDARPGTGDRQLRRPFPTMQSYQLLAANGDLIYHGLELKLEKRPGPEGLSTLLAYTWAKSIDTAGGRATAAGDTNAVSNNVTLASNRGLSEGNIPGRLAWLVGYDLPFGPGKQHMTDSLLGKLIGGWSTYGILTLQKGQWFTASMSSDRVDAGTAASQRPDMARNPNLPSDQRTVTRWFDTDAFLVPRALTYGNAGRSVLEGPGLANLDFSLLRNFRINETSRVEFRFEAFNLTNHTNFRLPGTSCSVVAPGSSCTGSTFGVIGGAFEARDLQFGFKIYF